MRSFFGALVSLAMLLPGDSGGDVQVVIDKVGSDETTSGYPIAWCDSDHHYVAQGGALRIRFEGHSTTGAPVSARLQITQNASDFAWDKDQEPAPTFPVERGEIGTFTIIAKRAFTWQYPEFRAVDANNGSSGYRMCKALVVPYLRKVEVTSLRWDPDRQKLVLAIKNTSAGELGSVRWSVWAMTRDPSHRTVPLASGARSLVQAEEVFEATARSPLPGQYYVYGAADPSRQIGENEADRGNNQRMIAWSGRLPSPVTQDLDYQRAAEAGAEFLHNIESQYSTCFRLGVGNWEDTSWAPESWQFEGGRRKGVLFMADCPATVQVGRASPEAYKNFRLKNGWKVKSVERSEPWSLGWNEFSLEGPAIGTDSPYMRAHVAAAATSTIRVGVRVIIEGPAGTDPYR